MPGDLILYQGNNLCIYYDTNTWNFTRIGKIDNATQEDVKLFVNAGGGDVMVTLSLSPASDTLRGDVNNDNKVNMDDLTALINHLVYGAPVSDGAAICDSLDSTTVSMDDLTALINFLVYGAWN